MEYLSLQRPLLNKSIQDNAKITTGLPAEKIKSLGIILAPPEAPKQVVRPVNPDWVIFILTGILPVFLLGIYQTQSNYLFFVLAALILFYGLYFWQRKNLVQKYQNQMVKQKQDIEDIKRSIGNWMELYYCDQDQCLFYSGESTTHPLREIKIVLLR